MGAVIEKFETAVTANGTVFRVGTILSRPTLVLAGIGTRPHVHVARSWQTPRGPVADFRGPVCSTERLSLFSFWRPEQNRSTTRLERLLPPMSEWFSYRRETIPSIIKGSLCGSRGRRICYILGSFPKMPTAD